MLGCAAIEQKSQQKNIDVSELLHSDRITIAILEKERRMKEEVLHAGKNNLCQTYTSTQNRTYYSVVERKKNRKQSWL